MEKKEKADSSAAAKAQLPRSLTPVQKIWIGLAVLFLLFVVCAGCGFLLKARLFENNPRFILKRIEIQPPDGYTVSYWNSEINREKREKQLAEELGLDSGTVNLFAVNPATLRKRLLAEHSEIADAVVRRVIPDTISFTITERIPIADIGRRVSEKQQPVMQVGPTRYLDENGIVISSEYTQKLALPRIIDLSDREVGRLQPGDTVQSGGVRLALDFIRLVGTSPDFQDIVVKTIALVSFNNSIQCTFKYFDGEFTAILPYPIQPERLRADVMGRLIPVLKEQYRKRDFSSIIDLRFKDQAVIRPRNKR